MRLIKRSVQQRKAVDAAFDAYVGWREECAAVQDAYHGWASAGTTGGALAFEAYESALEREEHAANVYAGLMTRFGDLVETGLPHQPAESRAGSGASPS
jgi:hypothetical protein